MSKNSQLLELLRNASPAYNILQSQSTDLGIAQVESFPLLAIVGQEEMKLALILSLINPHIGGVLLIGARGTAKTTAVRALVHLLPTIRRSICPEGQGCTEEAAEKGGMSAICKSCATRFGYGQPLTILDRVRMVELPLNALLEDVVGSINERVALEQQRVRLEKGILAQADSSILYIDEVNLLENAVANAILDAAAQGFYTVRRGALNLTYQSRFVLIGSMNPEEGRLRPQLMDRFGLRATVHGLSLPADRFLAYERAMWHKRSPEQLSAAFAEQTLALATEIDQARTLLPQVQLGSSARQLGLTLIESLQIGSSRAEITLFEAAKAYAAAAERVEVTTEDVQKVAPLALRLRQSPNLNAFFQERLQEDRQIEAYLQQILKGTSL